MIGAAHLEGEGLCTKAPPTGGREFELGDEKVVELARGKASKFLDVVGSR